MPSFEDTCVRKSMWIDKFQFAESMAYMQGDEADCTLRPWPGQSGDNCNISDSDDDVFYEIGANHLDMENNKIRRKRLPTNLSV